jgi:hypothetical protein
VFGQNYPVLTSTWAPLRPVWTDSSFGRVKVTGFGTVGEQKVNGRCLMMNHERLEMRWLPVLGADGRTRMEASWVLVPTAAPVQEHAVTHAA